MRKWFILAKSIGKLRKLYRESREFADALAEAIRYTQLAVSDGELTDEEATKIGRCWNKAAHEGGDALEVFTKLKKDFL